MSTTAEAVQVQVRCDQCGRRHVDVLFEGDEAQPVVVRFMCHRCGRQQRHEVTMRAT
jgi:ribosomal protein L37E